MICEICNFKGILEKHHINSKCYGGTNHKSNIAILCPNCHNMVHRGEIILEGKYQTSIGTKLIYHLKNDNFILNPNPPKVYLK